MARASFGGASDYSSVFASLYNQAASELKSQIDNAMNEAKRVAQAEDQRMIDEWKKGTVSDSELLDRLAMRRDEAMDEVDRSAFASLYTEYKELIADGNAEVKYQNNPAGLRAYYAKKAKGLNPNSAGYRRAMLKVGELDKAISGLSNQDGRKNDPATLNALQAFVGTSTDYKILLVKAYEGGMSTWPPTTSNGLTQAEVDTLIAGASTYDVPTGGITTDYIDQIDSEILSAIDVAISEAPAGKKVGFAQQKSKYLANHVTLHNDFQQGQVLTGSGNDGGLIGSVLTTLSDARRAMTDPADFKAIADTAAATLEAHFDAAGSNEATSINRSGGATSNEYQAFGTMLVGVMRDLASGKTTMDQAYSTLQNGVKNFPDYKDNWVKTYFSKDRIDALLGYDGTKQTGADTPFIVAAKFGAGITGMNKVPPTRAYVYGPEGGAFVGVKTETSTVFNQETGKYEKVTTTTPDLNPKLDDGQAWTMVVMDVNGKPALVPAVATYRTAGVPMQLVDESGNPVTDSGKIKDLYKRFGSGIVNQLRPAFATYEVSVGDKSYTYIGGTPDTKGILRGGTWIPSDKFDTLLGATKQNYGTGDATLEALLRSAGLTIPENSDRPWKPSAPGEPLPYFGGDTRAFRDIVTGKMGGYDAIVEESKRHGIGTDSDGKIDLTADEAQLKIWADSYEPSSSMRIPGLGPVGGRGGTGAGGASRPTGLTGSDNWDRATDAKLKYNYDKEYSPYMTMQATAPTAPGTDPIANVLGVPQGEQPYRYAPNVDKTAFGTQAVSDYAKMASSRTAAVPKISMADTWDRGLATTPTPPAASTTPTPAPTVPKVTAAPPRPLAPKGTAGPELA